jgi:non-ribosomal peptide synthetase component F
MYRDLPGEKALAASQFEKEREYWQEKLSGELEKSSFPPDAGTSGKTEKEWDAISFQLPPGLNRRLMTISGDSDSRLHMLLVTGLSLLLYKYTGQTDIIIGTPIDKQEIEGEFINTILPIRTQIEEHGTVKEYLLQVKQVIIEAGKNQNYPIETIPYDLDMPAAAGEFPLFAVALVLENIQDPSYLSHINLEMIYTIRKKAGAIEGVVRYNTGLYTADAVQRIINHYIYLLQEAYNQVEMKLVEVPVLTAEEKRQVLEEFNRTHREYPRHKMIHRLTEEQAGKTPGNLAVEWQSQSLTYKQLN